MGKSSNPPKVIGYSAEQARIAREFQETVAKNTPRDILDAFFPAELVVGDIKLQPVDLATFMLLEQIESPLAVVAANGAAAPVGFTHLAQALLVISLPPDAAAALVANRQKFDESVTLFARRVSGGQILEAGAKVRDQIAKAFATAIPTAPASTKASSGGPLDKSTAGPS